ncbi:MAG TPA: ethanolamine ammonia-lyase reactivating factor EutA [Patescibacteria group bacterium]|nr:ethanolamine ammonia-lyase reactivating factor EutA [Patescibacteria group bacterium]
MSAVSGRTREMLSVGIDVGTTTTQVVFTRLSIRDVARIGLLPRIEVDATSILYRSPIQFTPLTSPDEVDARALAELIAAEYRNADVRPGDVETGAVIITGEIARTKNADAILQEIAGLAGDFVVTVAGPGLEAQIAGRGSGAARYSTDHYTQVTNVDIGGGTSNASVFRLGEHLASAGIAVGGRLVQIDHASGTVRHLAPPGRRIVEALGLPIREGEPANLGALRRFCGILAELVADLAAGVESDLGRSLALTPPLRHAGGSTAVFLSGGVAACYYDNAPAETLAAVAMYGDVGPLLARALHDNERLQRLAILRPPETLQATVLGASSQTVTLSGSTIWAEEELLPLRNLPVVRPILENGQTTPSLLAQAIREAVARWDSLREGMVAVALDVPGTLDYSALSSIAGGLAEYAASDLPPGWPMVAITHRDYAQALGQTVKGMRPDLPLVVIDQVGLGEGDFIDIGRPVLDGRVVPLSVKTLVFYR